MLRLFPSDTSQSQDQTHSLRKRCIPFLTLILAAAVGAFVVYPLLPSTVEKRFVSFTENVFANELSGNALSLHYTLADPSAYNVDDGTISLGDASLAARQRSCAVLENYLTTLEQFDYDKLSSKRQLTYDIFHDYLETELSAADYLLYDEPLSPTLGIQAQLPILLAEYTFRTKGDIEDYLCLLTRVPDYFSSIISFEQDKSEAGLFMSTDCAIEVVSQCQEFIADAENNYLIDIFNEKIDAITNLTADEKIGYKSRNVSALNAYVIPAYQELIAAVAALGDSGTNEMGLYYYPEGSAYYEYLVRSVVGDDRSIDAIEEAVKVQMVEDYAAIQEILAQYQSEAGENAAQETEGAPQNGESEQDDSSAQNDSSAQSPDPDQAAPTDGPEAAVSVFSVIEASSAAASVTPIRSAASSDPAQMLAELREKITADFPLPVEVSCTVKYVHSSLQEYLSPAFYLTPTIDDYQNNVIYINPASDYNELELYTTLAHEGYPGHLYQSVYFCAQEPDLIRYLLDVGGYTEGWATYVEMYAYSLWDGDQTLASLYQHNRAFTLGLASLIDIGIHYRGYTPSDVTAFLAQLGFSENTASSLYNAILQSPANYLQYYVGYLNFMELRNEMQEQLAGSFSLKEFHRQILETGPAPFYILRKHLSGAA